MLKVLMDKSQIQTLLARIDVWLLVFGVIVVVGVAGESFFGIRHWWNSRKLQTIQEAEERQREETIAKLNQEAAALRREAQEQAARYTERQADLEREQQKTAVAQQKAAEAQLALKKAVTLVATPRRIILGNRNGDEEIRKAKFEALKKYADTPTVVVFVRDDEAEILANDIVNALVRMAGWKSVAILPLASTAIPLGFIQEGVQIRTLQIAEEGKKVPTMAPIPGTEPPAFAKALMELLNLDLGPPNGTPFGVSWQPDAIVNGIVFGLGRYGFNIPHNGVAITVGRKPLEQTVWGIPEITPK